MKRNSLIGRIALADQDPMNDKDSRGCIRQLLAEHATDSTARTFLVRRAAQKLWNAPTPGTGEFLYLHDTAQDQMARPGQPAETTAALSAFTKGLAEEWKWGILGVIDRSSKSYAFSNKIAAKEVFENLRSFNNPTVNQWCDAAQSELQGISNLDRTLFERACQPVKRTF